jgi:dinuclear metal center YbgI/SA1388 family protein
MKVRDVYQAINAFAPFMAQEKWDNSGILVGGEECGASRVLVTLDISPAAVEQAELTNCDVIVSHHPVIFSPLKNISFLNPVYDLCRLEISAICCHTPLDIADGGLNDLLAERLGTAMEIIDISPLLIGEPGRILTLREPMTCADIAKAAKESLGCTTVRFAGEDRVRRLGICTGSGSSLLEDIAGVCDCLLTGDVKHDRWYKAQELGMGLIDCGHYHTEILMVPYMARMLRRALPGLEVVEFVEGDPVSYV